MAKFLHNKSTANVSLMEGRITIPVGGKVGIADSQASDESIQHALGRGWISIEGAKSSTPTPKEVEPITFTPDEFKGSTTIPVVEKKKSAATSVKLGTGESAAA